MSTSLVKPENTQLTTYREEQIQLIKDTFAKGASDSELKLFIAVAERKGLDIFSRQIHLVKRYDKKLNREIMEVQTGIDGYRLIAERTGRYEGQIGPMWCGNDGNWKDVWLAKEPPAAAKVGILKAGAKEPFFGIALYREYVQTYKEGNPFPMWAKMPANQLAKCAEALALRKAFPGELSGIYTQEEMAQATTAEDVIDVEPVRDEKPVKPLALVPPVQVEKAPEQFEQDHDDMDTYIAAAWKAAGREQILDAWKAENNYGAKPLQWKQEQLDILNEEARKKVKAKAIADPLPETQNTENEQIEQERIALIDEMKTTWLTASSESDWDVFTGKYDLYGMSIKDLKGTLNKIKEKATAILAAKAQPKSNEPASELPAESKTGPRNSSGKNADEESGREKALIKNNKQPGNQGAKLKGAVDDLCAEFWPNDKNEGYKACREKAVTITGAYWRNWDELSADDAAKVLAMFSRWNPADDKPKGKAKK